MCFSSAPAVLELEKNEAALSRARARARVCSAFAFSPSFGSIDGLPEETATRCPPTFFLLFGPSSARSSRALSRECPQGRLARSSEVSPRPFEGVAMAVERPRERLFFSASLCSASGTHWKKERGASSSSSRASRPRCSPSFLLANPPETRTGDPQSRLARDLAGRGRGRPCWRKQRFFSFPTHPPAVSFLSRWRDDDDDDAAPPCSRRR